MSHGTKFGVCKTLQDYVRPVGCKDSYIMKSESFDTAILYGYHRVVIDLLSCTLKNCPIS